MVCEICVVVIGRLSAEVLEKTKLYSSETLTVSFVVLRLEVSSKDIDVMGHLEFFSSSG